MAFFRKKKDEGFDDLELPPMPEEMNDLPPLPSRRKPMAMPEMAVPKFRPSAPIHMEIKQSSSKMPQFEEGAKVFVRMDKYKDIMKTIESMEHKVVELEKTLNKIASIKDKESEIIHGWAAMLNEAKDNLETVNAKLLRPE